MFLLKKSLWGGRTKETTKKAAYSETSSYGIRNGISLYSEVHVLWPLNQVSGQRVERVWIRRDGTCFPSVEDSSALTQELMPSFGGLDEGGIWLFLNG